MGRIETFYQLNQAGIIAVQLDKPEITANVNPFHIHDRQLLVLQLIDDRLDGQESGSIRILQVLFDGNGTFQPDVNMQALGIDAGLLQRP